MHMFLQSSTKPSTKLTWAQSTFESCRRKKKKKKNCRPCLAFRRAHAIAGESHLYDLSSARLQTLYTPSPLESGTMANAKPCGLRRMIFGSCATAHWSPMCGMAEPTSYKRRTHTNSYHSMLGICHGMLELIVWLFALPKERNKHNRKHVGNIFSVLSKNETNLSLEVKRGSSVIP